jgi:hypothetical protein
MLEADFAQRIALVEPPFISEFLRVQCPTLRVGVETPGGHQGLLYKRQVFILEFERLLKMMPRLGFVEGEGRKCPAGGRVERI